MSDDIFRNNAPLFWEKGLTVVPVAPGTKQPPKALKGWQGWVSGVPNEEKQAEFLEAYAICGVGLLLGMALVTGEVLVAFDVDDDKLVALVQRLLQLQMQSLGLRTPNKTVC